MLHANLAGRLAARRFLVFITTLRSVFRSQHCGYAVLWSTDSDAPGCTPSSCAEFSSTSCPNSQVTISPDPPIHGQDLRFTIDGNMAAVATGGTVKASVIYWGVRVYQQITDLCQTVSVCPLQPGPVQVRLAGHNGRSVGIHHALAVAAFDLSLLAPWPRTLAVHASTA